MWAIYTYIAARAWGPPDRLAMCEKAGKLEQLGRWILGGISDDLYPLVNIQITMENHHFLWENQLFLWPFSIAMLNYQRVYMAIKPLNIGTTNGGE